MGAQVVRLVFVGHVDHGKSTLIGRLLVATNSLPRERIAEVQRVSAELGKEAELAYLTDYLQEERERNITIDTTQIFFRTRKRSYVIIDAPGHVEFIKNMLSGASQAEAGVLIVDAREGVMEQTRRHAYLIHLLGIRRLVAVVNKMDLIDYRVEGFDRVKKDLTGFLGRMSLSPDAVIPVSARLGENIAKYSRRMDWYQGPVFIDALDRIRSERDKRGKPLRLPVQDVLPVRGRRTILGRVEAGSVERGQSLTILPGGLRARAVEILRFGERRKGAHTGESIGLVIDEDHEVHRGAVIVQGDAEPLVTDEVRLTLFWMGDEPFAAGSELSLQCSTQEVGCRPVSVERRIDSSTLEVLEERGLEVRKNEVGLVTLKLQRPIVLEPFTEIPALGRVVLRKEGEVLGIGIIQSIRSIRSIRG
jgi:sulfate adenylyltransferase subunit 1